VDRYWQRIRRWLWVLTGHEHQAEDLTQETFFKAWLGLPRLETDDRFRPWLVLIARNLALDFKKKPPAPVALPDAMVGREPEPPMELAAREASASWSRLARACPKHTAFPTCSGRRLSCLTRKSPTSCPSRRRRLAGACARLGSFL